MGKPNRIKAIDNIKWVILFLVVLGHNDFGDAPFRTPFGITKLIYVFHMPVCMLLTGYMAFFEFSKYKSNKEYFKNVIVGYVLTAVIVVAIHFIVMEALVKNPKSYEHISYPAPTNWYLYAMILCGFGLMLFHYLDLKLKSIAAASIGFLFVIGLQAVPLPSYFYFERIIAHTPYYILGYYFAKKISFFLHAVYEEDC